MSDKITDLTAELDKLTGAALDAIERGDRVKLSDHIAIVLRGASVIVERSDEDCAAHAVAIWTNNPCGRRQILRKAIFVALGEEE